MPKSTICTYCRKPSRRVKEIAYVDKFFHRRVSFPVCPAHVSSARANVRKYRQQWQGEKDDERSGKQAA